MGSKKRLDLLLLERGIAESRTKAQALILAGQVLVNGMVAKGASQLTDTSSSVELKAQNPYVSRGGLKLEPALRHFGIQLQGKFCLDVGASTGGFTDCLLSSGAKKVLALDVGRGQLHQKLRQDPRVMNLEKTNIRHWTRPPSEEPFDLATIDVSFISLKKVLPAVLAAVKKGGEILALVKPQFELAPKYAKKGVVREESWQRTAVEDIIRFAEEDLHVQVIGQVPSSLKGPRGNQEYFLYVRS